MSNLTAAEQSRFDSKWEPKGDCHIWIGPLDRDGYGTFYLRQMNRRAHRVAWYATHGEIPAGLVVNHSCRRRACVNVQHLRLFTPYENSMTDSAGLGYVNSRKVACPRGHEYDQTITTPAGKVRRICTICERAKARRLNAKWRAANRLAV